MPDFCAYLLVSGGTLLTTAILSFTWPFSNQSWGTLLYAVVAGICYGILQVYAIGAYAHPKCFGRFLSYISCLPSFVIYTVGVYLSLDKNWSIGLPSVMRPSRNFLYVVAWTLPYYISFLPHTRVTSLDVYQMRLIQDGEFSDADPIQQKSNTWPFFGAAITFYFVFTFVAELFGSYFVPIGGMIALSCYALAHCLNRNCRVEYDVPAIFFVAAASGGAIICLVNLLPLGKLNPVLGSVCVAVFGSVGTKLVQPFCAKITTTADSMLFLFPIYLALDLTQALFYISDSTSLYSWQFWALLSFQEIKTVLLNTGLVDWFLHFASLSPEIFWTEDRLSAQKSKTNMHTASEQLAVASINMALVGGVFAQRWGANMSNRLWLGLDDYKSIHIRFAVVSVVRFAVFGFEKLIQKLVSRYFNLARSSHQTQFSKPRAPLLAFVLAASCVFQVLVISDQLD